MKPTITKTYQNLTNGKRQVFEAAEFGHVVGANVSFIIKYGMSWGLWVGCEGTHDKIFPEIKNSSPIYA